MPSIKPTPYRTACGIPSALGASSMAPARKRRGSVVVTYPSPSPSRRGALCFRIHLRATVLCVNIIKSPDKMPGSHRRSRVPQGIGSISFLSLDLGPPSSCFILALQFGFIVSGRTRSLSQSASKLISFVFRKPSEEDPPDIVEHQHGSDEDGRQLHDGDLVTGGGHAAEAARGAGEGGAHRGEGIGL